MSLRRVAVVGAGHAGVQTAACLRDEGFEGEIVLFGAESDLPYHRPPLSKNLLAPGSPAVKPLRPVAFYDQNSIALELGKTVSRIDVSNALSVQTDKLSLGVDAVILAPGAAARQLRCRGGALQGIHTLRSAADAVQLRAALEAGGPVVILGAGFIGLEIAASIATSGRDVTVVEAGERVLGRMVPPEVSTLLESMHRGWGTSFSFQRSVEKFIGTTEVTAVRLDNGEILPAAVVIVAIGSEPRLELARSAGLACGDGLLVDGSMRTSTRNIFAAGDCVSVHLPELGRRVRLESIQSANEQARRVARSLLGKMLEPPSVPWFWSDQVTAKLQIAGLPRPDAHPVLLREADPQRFTLLGLHADRLAYAITLNAAADHMAARQAIAQSLRLEPNLAGSNDFVFQAWFKSCGQARASAAA